jgi:hypothetical protein
MAMRERASIESLIGELQALMRRRHDAGVSAVLECELAASTRGAVLAARARVYAPAETLAGLQPVLGCEELPDVSGRVFRERQAAVGYRDYALKLRLNRLKPDKLYHFTLQPSPGTEPIARCTAYTFSRRAVARTRRQIREIFLAPKRPGAASGRRRRR